MTQHEDTPCRCGCGEVVSPGKTWVLGHHSRGENHPTRGRKINRQRVYVRRPAIHRVLEKVVVDEDGCWLVEGVRRIFGYTRMTISPGVVVGSHRVSYEFFHGPIPEGYTVDHTCHNNDETCHETSDCKHRRCVNPKHLEAVTPSLNVSRGRGPAITVARYAAQTHCHNGHEFTPENTYTTWHPAGYQNRHCRICVNAKNRRHRARKRAS